MKVLHVNKFLYRRGGAEAYLLDLADLQRRRGDETSFFAMEHPHNLPSTNGAAFPREVVLDPLPRQARARLRTAGRMVWSTSARKGIGTVADAESPDVVHLHNVYHQLSPSIIGPLVSRGLPVVLTAHDYKLACPTYQLLDHGRICDACVGGSTLHAVRRRCKDGSFAASGVLALESMLHRTFAAYAGVGAFVAPSRFLADVLVRAGLPAARVHHVPHFAAAVTTTVDRPDRIVTVGDGRPSVVFAGRLSDEKGVDVLVRAMADVPDGRLVVAGDGPERSRLEALAVEVLGDRTAFVGHLDREALHALVASARCTVLPARWHENQPMSVLESFALGVPVVASTLGGLPELVWPDRTGLLVAPDDPVALATALRSLVADETLARRLGSAARDFVGRDHTTAAHLAALDAVYASAATVTRSRRSRASR